MDLVNTRYNRQLMPRLGPTAQQRLAGARILYTEADIGRNKPEAARDRLRQLNSEITIGAIDVRVDADNIDDLLSGYEIIIEGGDSLAGRLLCNDYCIRTRTPMVHASAQYGYGYILTVLPGETACFCCAFPGLPAGHGGSVPVFGVATGIAGSLGAGEVIKLITESGDIVTNGYLTFSVFSGSSPGDTTSSLHPETRRARHAETKEDSLHPDQPRDAGVG